jgi:hypothetical protein
MSCSSLQKCFVLNEDVPVAGDNVEASIRKDALQAKVPLPVYQQPFSHTLLTAESPENDFLVATKEPALSHASFAEESARRVHTTKTNQSC